MNLKYYGGVSNLDEAVDFYKDFLQATGKPHSSKHAYLKLFNEIPFMLRKDESFEEQDNFFSLVITFDRMTSNLYHEALVFAKSQNLQILVDNYQGPWGTTYTELIDPYGVKWNFEIATEHLAK